MDGEGGGLSSEVVLAAWTLQNAQQEDPRRANTASSVGASHEVSQYSPWGGGGGGTEARSLPRQIGGPAAGTSGSPPKQASTLGTSPSASPTRRSPLGPSSQRADAADGGSDWQQLHPGEQRPSSAGTVHWGGDQQRQPHDTHPTPSGNGAECATHSSYGALPQPADAPAAAGHDPGALHSPPSFAFAAAPAPGCGQRRTTVSAAPASSAAAPAPRASTLEVGLAAAAATEHMLAASEHQRRQAVRRQEQREEEEEVVRRGTEEEGRTGAGAAGLAAAEAGQEGGVQGKKGGSGNPSREPSTDSSDLGLEAIAEVQETPWYRSLSFWGRTLSLTLSLLFFLSGVVTLVAWPDLKLLHFSVWRWCFFLGCWPPIYWASVWAVWMLTRICEWRMFAARTAIYFLVGTRGALMLVLRSCLVLAAFAALFQTQPDKDQAAVQEVFKVILRVLACVVLATVANLIKKVAIKLMATHHHREAHFGRMQEALRKEYFLSVLSQPREPRGSCFGSDSQDGFAGGLQRRPKSFAKRWLSRNMLSKSMAASLPSLATRSFSRRSIGELMPQRSQSDTLLMEGSELSDAQLARPGSCCGGGGATAVTATAVEKSNHSATAALTSISIVVGAGIEPSSKSMPNLAQAKAAACLGSSGLQQQLYPGSRLAPQPPATAAAAAAAAAEADGTAGKQPRLLHRLPPSAAASGACSPAGAAAAHPGLRVSLASRQLSMLSECTAPRSLSFRAPSQAGSLASIRTTGLGAGASKAPPPLSDLIDLRAGPPPQQGRAGRGRRTSIAQMPPEELEKMQHIEKHIRKNRLKLGLVDQLGHMKHLEGGQTGADEQEARRMAYFLYHNLRASRKRSWIQQSDLEDFLPLAQAAEAFLYLDIDGNGQISAHEVRDSVLKIFQERAFLACTLRDTKSVMGSLERMLGALLHTLFLFLYLSIFQIDVTRAWLTFSSIMLAFAFIFGNTIRTVFECCIWLFVVHPYDVGDTLLLGGENHRVEEIALLNTVLVRQDGARLYCPNSRLNSDQLFNISRSARKSESIKLSLDMDTPLDVVEMLRATLEKHVKGSPQEFTGASAVNVRGLGDPMKLHLTIWYEFTHNGVDTGRCSRARSGLYMVVASALNAAHVHFTLPPLAGGDFVAARVHAAMEAQPELSAGMGLPPIPTAP